MTEKIEMGIIISPARKVIDLGGSKAITLPKEWIKIQKWLGREVTELASVADEFVVLAPPEKIEKAKRVIRELEGEKYG